MQADELGIFSLEALDQISSHSNDELKHIPYVVASGSANTYTASLTPAPLSYVDGMPVAVKINATNSGASTINVNGLGPRPIKDSRGNAMSAGRLNASIIYTMRYEASNGNFILMGEGSGGTASAGDVLSGKTFTNDNGPQTGTMINKVGTGVVIIPSTVDQAIPQGYYGGVVGDGKCLGDADLIPGNIKSGVNVFGVIGSLIPLSSTAHGGNQSYTSPGSYMFTVPDNITSIVACCWGGGGGGCGTATPNYGYYCGGGGGFAVGLIPVNPGQQIPVTVGNRGLGTPSADASNIGGTSSVGTYVSATGGGRNVGGSYGGTNVNFYINGYGENLIGYGAGCISNWWGGGCVTYTGGGMGNGSGGNQIPGQTPGCGGGAGSWIQDPNNYQNYLPYAGGHGGYGKVTIYW